MRAAGSCFFNVLLIKLGQNFEKSQTYKIAKNTLKNKVTQKAHWENVQKWKNITKKQNCTQFTFKNQNKQKKKQNQKNKKTNVYNSVPNNVHKCNCASR